MGSVVSVEELWVTQKSTVKYVDFPKFTSRKLGVAFKSDAALVE